MMVLCSSPTRIDLAGGTLDIFPIYHVFDGALTINAAIDLSVEVNAVFRDDTNIVIRSDDLKKSLSFESIDELHHNHELSMLSRGIQFFYPLEGLEVTINSNIPPRSGLGGSSSLSISICGALNKLLDTGLDRAEIINLAQGIETATIKIPTGRQDYIAAMYGGINSIEFGIEESLTQFEVSSGFKEELESSLILLYIEPHQSMISNWDVFKKVFDNNRQTIKAMQSVNNTAEGMYHALVNENYNQLHLLINEEWNNRIRLSEKVCTPKMDRIIKKIDNLEDDITYKAVGAGGGGCMLLSCVNDRKEVLQQLKMLDVEVLDFNLDFMGMVVN
jgi:D-glycero-alpha-D-manno-heptose-7-phosphate kinase